MAATPVGPLRIIQPFEPSAQLHALVLGLPWRRIGEAGVITLL